MSGRSGYGNGYGYADAGRYEQSDGFGVNGYGGRSAGDNGGTLRPGGYGGFYPESSQQPHVPSAPSPERRRDRSDRDRLQSSSQSASRSRTRNDDAERRYQSSRDRSRGATGYTDSRGRDRNGSDGGALSANSREMQSVEGTAGSGTGEIQFADESLNRSSQVNPA